MNRYRPLKSNIVDQTEHTIKLSNGAVLRKSGVALRKAKLPKKRAPGQITAPPTPWDLKRKLLTSSNQPSSLKGTKGTFHSTMGKRSRFQSLEFAEDSESESEDHLPLSTTKQVVKQTSGGANGGEDGQGTSIGGRDQVQPETITIRPSNYETATEYTLARETEIGGRPVERKYRRNRTTRDGARGRTNVSNRGEKAGSETTTCFLFKPRFG